MVNPLRAIARCFVVPCDERGQPEKVVPARLTFCGRELLYKREIRSTLTGEIIAYEQEGGNWIIDDEAHTREFRASQALSYPYAPSCGSSS